MKLEIGMISAAALLGLAASVVILMGAGGGETADTGYTESDINSASHYSRSSVKTIEIHRAEDEMQELTDISECTITLKKKAVKSLKWKSAVMKQPS